MDIRWNELARYRLIELIAMWEGRVTATHLKEFFEIGREAASKVINRYKEICPHNLEYDLSLKGYKPGADFTPKFTQGKLDEYQQLVESNCDTYHLSGLATDFDAVNAPMRNIAPELIRPVLQACREKRRLDICYRSVSNPQGQDRIISPHTLVYDGLRYHVRAYDELSGEFRDFVLSRFSGEPELEGPAEFTEQQDEDWQTFVDVVIEPDPRLSDDKKQLLCADYQMTEGSRTLKCRAALVNYLILRLRLDKYDTNAEAQQIILNPDCRKQLSKYLPD